MTPLQSSSRGEGSNSWSHPSPAPAVQARLGFGLSPRWRAPGWTDSVTASGLVLAAGPSGWWTCSSRSTRPAAQAPADVLGRQEDPSPTGTRWLTWDEPGESRFPTDKQASTFLTAAVSQPAVLGAKWVTVPPGCSAHPDVAKPIRHAPCPGTRAPKTKGVRDTKHWVQTLA